MASDNERLRAVDSIWLDADTLGPPIAIGSLATAEGPAPDVTEVRALIGSRLDRMPRLRERVAPAAGGVKRPTWEPVGDVDLGYHVRTFPVEAPGDSAALERAVSTIMEAPLDPERPLWDVHLLSPVEGARWAMVTRMHHAVADGQGAVLLLGRMIDVSADGGTTLTDALDGMMRQLAGASGGAPPAPKDQLAEAAARGGDLLLRALRKGITGEEAAQAVEAVRGKASAAAESLTKASEALATVQAGKPGSLSGGPGDRRTWLSLQVPLADVKAIRAGLGGTVNDVVMTLMSGGYRKLLTERGEDVSERVVRVLVPVSVRAPGDLASNNQVSGLIVMIPLAGAERERLARISEHIGALKDVGAAGVGKLMFDLNQAAPAGVQSLVVRTFNKLPAVIMETLVTNVPGPQFPVYLAGRRVTSMTPIIPLGGFLRINTGILSYDGQLNFGISGGADAAEDVHLLREGIKEAAESLLAAAR